MDKTMDTIVNLLNESLRPIVIVSLILTILYNYLTWTFNFWSERGVPHQKPTIILGNFGDLLLFRKSLPETVKSMYDSFPNADFTGVYRVRSPILIIRDPNLIRHVCVENFGCFINRGITVNRTNPLSGHLFNLEGAEWKQMRSTLVPAFTSAKIKRMFYLLIDCHEILRKSIDDETSSIIRKNEDRKTDGVVINVRKLATKFTIDVIGTCAFGININALKNEDTEFFETAKKLSEPSYKATLWRILRSALPKLYKIIGVRIIDDDVTKFFTDVVTQVVAQREREEGFKRQDFMDLLIELKHKRSLAEGDDNEDNRSLDDEEGMKEIELDDDAIAAQAFAFFVAGNETSSNTIAFCLQELALNEDIQRKARREIHNCIDKTNGKLTYESVQEMKYLNMIVMETLRKYPPAPLLSRRCARKWKIPGTDVELPAGMRVVIPIYGIHHDSNYYPHPETFDPERFAEETKAARHRYTYLPFGEGPRNCIGMRFAMLQTKIGIISFLRDHQVEICEKTVVPIKFSRRSLVTSCEGGFWLKIKKIT